MATKQTGSKGTKGWRARVKLDQVEYYLGTYANRADAIRIESIFRSSQVKREVKPSRPKRHPNKGWGKLKNTNPFTEDVPMRVTFNNLTPERYEVLNWLKYEWQDYADKKWDGARPGHDKQMATEGLASEGFWYGQIIQYFGRANTLGLDQPNGRQSIAKGLATLFGALESIVRTQGRLPEPGYPSGEVIDRDS